MRPAPALLATDQPPLPWLYLAGPLIGACAGALAYQLIRGPAPQADGARF